jgi:hypothetical protein
MVSSYLKTVNKIEIDKAGYLFLQKACYKNKTGKELNENALARIAKDFDRVFTKGKKEYWDKDLLFTCEEAKQMLEANGFYYKQLKAEDEIVLSLR